MRARLVHLLLSQEMCTSDLAAVVGVSESAVSQHLRLLRVLRLVKPRRAGRIVYYSLDDGHVADLVRTGARRPTSGREERRVRTAQWSMTELGRSLR